MEQASKERVMSIAPMESFYSEHSIYRVNCSNSVDMVISDVDCSPLD